jgi:hypothetical protein
MNWLATISLAVMATLAVANAEDSPSQPLSPSPSTGEEEPALPTLEADPSNPEPGLLPESGELPAQPPAEVQPSSTRVLQQSLSEKEGRFDEIRSLAMTTPRAAYLLKRARRYSSSSSSRRTYLRAYYVTVAARMRKLDPELKSSIDAYEEAKIDEVSGTKASTARASSHSSKIHRTASREVHHKLHRVSSRNRYRRIIVIDDPYGPGFSPYGFSPYGPPVGFYPW